MGAQQAKSNRSVWLLVAGAAVVGLLIGAIAVVIVWPGDSSAKAVTLEPADQPGPDPFTDSVQTSEVPTIAQPAAVKATAMRDQLSRDATTSVLVATGTAPGLYGGSGDVRVCDAEKLVSYLDEHQDKAQAFADVLGIAPDGIAGYVAALTPIVLVQDTVVTNHGFEDGHATELRSVLQAGTAVMVDAQGVPRVKCNCGNPLTPPEVVSNADWNVKGDPWDGFDVTHVAGVVAGDTVTQLVLIDITTGVTYTQPVGSGSGSTPNIDGDWTIDLRMKDDLQTPLPVGRVDPKICPNSTLQGAVMRIRGTEVTITGATGFGGDLVGTVGGAPEGSPDWLQQIQKGTNGVVIKVHPKGEAGPELTFNLATTDTTLAGTMSMTGAQDPSVRVYQCETGIVATKAGSTPTATTPSTTPSTVSTSTTTSTPATQSAPSGDRCSVATLTAVVQSYVNEPIVGLEVGACNDRWAALTYGVGGQDDGALLEWDGSTWTTGACQRYRDPVDWVKSTEVPAEFWWPCISD